ncbi:MAG: hypothetical protein FD188_3491 [Ignavibacteria bacterium]|nr:MAG: hypothetical protein FD188_3491 [Ignavibacteria bacterium]
MRNLMGLPCSGNSSTTCCSTPKTSSPLACDEMYKLNPFQGGVCSIQDTFATLSRKHHMRHHYDEWMPATKNKWSTVPTGLDSITDAEMQMKATAQSSLEFVDETDDDATIIV